MRLIENRGTHRIFEKIYIVKSQFRHSIFQWVPPCMSLTVVLSAFSRQHSLKSISDPQWVRYTLPIFLMGMIKVAHYTPISLTNISVFHSIFFT